MNTRWILEPIKDRKSLTDFLTGSFLAVWLISAVVLGCTHQHRNSGTAPARLRADGLAAAGKFRAVVVEDMDNDGNLDIVGGASSPGMITLSYGNGRGDFSAPQIFPVKGDISSVAVADFNEDGRNDIVFSVQRETHGIRLWLNQPDRSWRVSKGPIDVNHYEGIKTADVNGDGHLDIIAANSTSDTQGGIQVWLGNGEGGWHGESGPTITGIYMDVALADLNGDQALDLVGAGWGTYGALQIWFGDGAGNWSSASPISKGNFYGLRIGDVNGDGNWDILSGSYRTGTQIFLGDGRGDFAIMMSPEDYIKRRAQAQPEIYKGSEQELSKVGQESFWTVLPVDLDQDGAVDILAGSVNQKGIMAWRNRGQNRWELFEGRFPFRGTYYEMVPADLNGDGYLEVCAASFGEGIKIWPGKSGVASTAARLDDEPLAEKNRLAVLGAPLENKVYATIGGLPEYKVGAGDSLEITFWKGSTPTKEEILVRQDGKISFGFVEDLPVNGLTASQLDELLSRHFGEYIRNPRIDVIVKNYDSKFVTLLGAITYKGYVGTGPGKYRLAGKTTLLEAITKAGGPARDADLENVMVRRQDGRTVSLDLLKTIQQGNPEQDFILDDEDVVFIPTINKKGSRVYVFGEVEKPGAYEYTGSEMHLFDAISEAGGPTAFAAADNTKVVRGDPTKPEIISANLTSLLEEGDQSQNVTLASGDLVYVPRSGLGEVNLFAKRIRPLLELIIWPARTIIDWSRAANITGAGD